MRRLAFTTYGCALTRPSLAFAFCSASLPTALEVGEEKRSRRRRAPRPRAREPLPASHWLSEENQRAFLFNLALELKLDSTDLNSFYKVSGKDIDLHGGSRLLDLYKGSPLRLLSSLFPEHKWDLVKFKNKPKDFWKSLSNQKAVLIDIGKKLGVEEGPESISKWFKINGSQLAAHGGRELLEIYGGSPYRILNSLLPKYNWDSSSFGRRPHAYWDSMDNHKAFLEELSTNAGRDPLNLSLWYNVTGSEIEKNGGYRLLDIYGGSVYALLAGTYPDHAWVPWKFKTQAGSSFLWNDREALVRLIRHLESKLQIQRDEDWSRVSRKNLEEAEVTSFLKSKADLEKLLKIVYSEKPWNLTKTSKSK